MSWIGNGDQERKIPEKRRSNLVLFAVIILEGFTLLPLPQNGELLVSFFSIAKTEWIGVGDGCGKGAFDVFVGGRGPTRFSEDLVSCQLSLDVGRGRV